MVALCSTFLLCAGRHAHRFGHPVTAAQQVWCVLHIHLNERIASLAIAVVIVDTDCGTGRVHTILLLAPPSPPPFLCPSPRLIHSYPTAYPHRWLTIHDRPDRTSSHRRCWWVVVARGSGDRDRLLVLRQRVLLWWRLLWSPLTSKCGFSACRSQTPPCRW